MSEPFVMQRTQLIAAIVLVVAVVGLVLGRLSLNDSTPATAGSSPDVAAPAATGTDESTAPAATADAADTPAADEAAAPAPAVEALPKLGQAQLFTNLDGWLQTDADNINDFDGQVRIVQFWTFGCFNCKNTYAALRDIYDRWQPEGLEILGVHAPEFDFEKDPESIAASAEENGLIWPIALDTNKTNFRAWQPGRRFWPRVFVVDQTGEIRFDHIGEGKYDELEAAVAQLATHGP